MIGYAASSYWYVLCHVWLGVAYLAPGDKWMFPLAMSALSFLGDRVQVSLERQRNAMT